MLSDRRLTAIVPAAGEGKRMAPLNIELSKVMIPILGKPIIEYAIRNLYEAGVSDIIIVISKKSGAAIKKHFGTNYKGVEISYVYQPNPSGGPARAIFCALPKVSSEYFLVQLADSLADENIPKRVIETFFENQDADGVIAIRQVEDTARYGIVRYEGQKIVEVVEKPPLSKAPSNHAVMGTFILKTDLFKKAMQSYKTPKGEGKFPPQYLLEAKANLTAYFFNGKRVDFGKPQDLFNASLLISKKPVKCIAFDADNTLYNSHQAAPGADKAAMELLSEKLNTSAENLHKEWLAIVEKIKNSKDPKIRTRLWSYGELCKHHNFESKFAKEMFSTFTTVLLKNLKLTKDIGEVLTALPQDKYVVTDDINLLAEKKLNHLGLRGFFKDVLTSDKAGETKPSKKFYQSLLQKYEPEEVLVVGDNYQKDLKIPSELGMQVLFFEGEKSPKQLLFLKTANNIHIMGAAGAGAAAVAGIAKANGYSVSGCDLSPDSPYSKNLEVKIKKGHNKEHLTGVDMLVISPAVEKFNPQNEELQLALEKNIPVLTWQEFQGRYLQKDKFVICVAGAYGKSTTTSMIAQILSDAGFDPTAEIGAKVIGWKSNFKVGNSRYYVCEADEYNDNFLNYHPDLAIILNVAWDHPDFFKTKQSVFESYKKFVGNIKSGGTLIIGKDPDLAKLAKGRDDIKVIRVKDFGKYKLKMIGDFRKINADAAVTAAQILGIDAQLAKKSVQNFAGVGRRLEYKGEIGKMKFYDDYAVQPHTVLATSNALKDKYMDKKVLLVLEPHTFSRINTFFDDYIKNLKSSKVDRIFICDVYAAREKGDVKDLSQKLAQKVGQKAKYTGSISQTASLIRKGIKDFDIVCSMGAGDSYKLYDLIKQWNSK